MTTYEYNTEGQLVRAITVHEPEFSPDESALLLASRAFDDEPKNSLGTPLSESMDPANQFAYVAPTSPVKDWQEAALGRAQDLFYADPAYKDAPRHGHHWRAPTLKSGS